MLGWLAGPACGISFKRSVRIESALETGWSRILTDLQRMRAAEADGKHFFSFSLCNKCFSTVAEGILTATDRMVPNLESLSLPLSKIGA